MLETIYTFDKDTKETTGSYVKYSPDTIIDTSCSTKIETLPYKEGFTQIFDENGQIWEYIIDSRGKMQYDTATRAESEIKYFGEIKEGFTMFKPKNEFCVWNSALKKWVENKEDKAEADRALLLANAQAEYKRLMQIADTDLAPLNDAVELEIATDQEIARQKELKKYRVYLSRVPTQMDYPDLIDWPAYPQG